jgi:hypothetical protein
MPFGTCAPSSANRLGSFRNSTTSASSALASSAPATWLHLIEDDDSGLICVGFVFGIIFIVRQMKTTISSMKMIGAHVMICGSRLDQSYQCVSGMGVAAAAAVTSGGGVTCENGSIIASQYARLSAPGTRV